MDILEGVETTERYDGYYYSVKDQAVIKLFKTVCSSRCGYHFSHSDHPSWPLLNLLCRPVMDRLVVFPSTESLR